MCVGVQTYDIILSKDYVEKVIIGQKVHRPDASASVRDPKALNQQRLQSELTNDHSAECSGLVWM